MLEEERVPSIVPWPKQAESLRREYLQRRFQEWIGAGKRSPHNSLAGRLLEDLTKEAVTLVPGDSRFRDVELDQRFAEADSLVTGLMHAAMSYEEDYSKREEPNFWQHAADPIYEIRNKSHKLMYKESVEGVADQYLRQPLRSQLFDRTLLDMLLGLELYLFADEMLHRPTIPGLPARSPLKWPHPLWAVVRDTGIAAILLGIVVWAVASAMGNEWIGSWGGWVIGLCAILWVITVVWSLITLPFVWKRHFAARKQTFEVLQAMLDTYSQMQSGSVISARHVLDSANTSSTKGVVWPSPLFVLLEDVIARDGRI